MTFFYETLPIFLCGLAAGIVITALVGWIIKIDNNSLLKKEQKKVLNTKDMDDGSVNNPSFGNDEGHRVKYLAWIKMRRSKVASTSDKESF